ncbi:P-loop containing nucleoside triphosphate hydrolase protein [Ilyonectria robusta]|uniref:P-loop containing nucleoside triphosphate hydrolase protein n=1 Tax=Ilyonectria robusta TaxID=1079257 RepID=UPI001E8CFC4D|nr:P-loop containing nucleoside triphosphate hydrolase protein [Ilyonectria robusta]KAH8666239.1 P-loop containing nucleoside triphosphate hydrolase protein [Ilyonectria robusta]
MSDPLSLSASIAGLITLSTAVYTTLSNFADRVERAPKSTQEILHAVAEMRLALTSVSGLIDTFQRIPPRRKAMVQLDHLVICVSQAVMTFTDLEMFLSNWPEISMMQSSAWKRIRWALQEDKATRLVKRLSENKASLVLILNILQSESDFEAQMSHQALKGQMERLMDENREIRFLMNQIGDDIQTMAGSVKFHDDMSSIRSPTSPTTPRAIRTALRPPIMHPLSTRKSREPEHPSSDPGSDSPNSGTGQYSATSMSEASTPTSLPSLTSSPPPRRSFSIILDSTWVYGRVRANTMDLSMTSSRLQSRAWSMFSGLSLNDVSVISFIRLPLKLSDIPNDAWYRVIPRTPLAYPASLECRDKIIIAVVGEPVSGKSALVDRICGNGYSPSPNATIEDRHIIKLFVDDRQYQVEIVDTAGIDCYEYLVDEAILEAHGFIITCPAQGADLRAIQKFHKKISNKREVPGQGKKSPIAIAITKKDRLFDPLDRSIEDARAWAKREGCEFHLTSAIDGDCIQDPFMSVLRALVKSDLLVKNPPVAHLMGWI